jgi:hypothetical protein
MAPRVSRRRCRAGRTAGTDDVDSATRDELSMMTTIGSPLGKRTPETSSVNAVFKRFVHFFSGIFPKKKPLEPARTV